MTQTNIAPKKHSCIKWIIIIFIFFILICFMSVIGIGLLFFKTRNNFSDSKIKVAHLQLFGPIICKKDSDFFSSGNFVSSSEIVNIISKIKKNVNVKGILLEINSPGGTPVASAEIAEAIRSANLPTVAWIREVGASGAFWIASSANYIVAHPMSITGSIGVIANSFGFDEVLKSLKIKYRRRVAGDMKDIGDQFREETETEKEYLQTVINEIHNEFILAISKYRKMDINTVKKLANGLFYTGNSAYALKLIDQLGGKKEANEWLEKQIKQPFELQIFEKKMNFFESLFQTMNNFSESIGINIGQNIINSFSSNSKKNSIELN